ncbi:amino acid permease, partial [Streptomyces inhibens]|uniref:amino acid permease n=1 Tax=Streptomyces inhibens TaxID=2293571 RepID=UPI0036AEAC95
VVWFCWALFVLSGSPARPAVSGCVLGVGGVGALPGSGLWRRVHPRTGTPRNAVWLSAGSAALLAVPSLYSSTAYAAITSINVIGITPAYAIPIYLRIKHRDRFRPGPWNLGRWGVTVGRTAVTWVAFVTVLFCLPQTRPETGLLSLTTFNYAPVALLSVLALAWIWWRIAGKRTYEAPAVGLPAGSPPVGSGNGAP